MPYRLQEKSTKFGLFNIDFLYLVEYVVLNSVRHL